MDAVEAITAVTDHIRDSGVGYPTAGLVADRFEAGWSVSAPQQRPPGGPVGFLVGDSGRIEPVPAVIALLDAQQRFADQEHVAAQLAATTRPETAEVFAGLQQGVQPAGPEEPAVLAGFTVVEHQPADPAVLRRDNDIREQVTALQEPIAQQLAALGPAGWQQLVAVFSLTVRSGIARLQFGTEAGWQAAQVPGPVVEQVRRLREASAGMSAGPWWRMMLALSNTGRLEVNYDYGEHPFSEDQLQPAEHYRDDITTYPRPQLPVWLAGYLAGPDAQGRTPTQAAAGAAADQAAGRRGVDDADGLEALPDLWARWAVLAAVYVGARSQWGPRITPGVAWHEADNRSGACLYVLPGDRAVLSGGRWNSPLLAGAYRQGGPQPDLYTGAPAWVNDSVLDTRNQHGLLSFCYWWFHGGWRRGGTDTAGELTEALPAIWTPEETVAAMSTVVGPGVEAACTALLAAADHRRVAREDLSGVFSQFREPDLDSAWNQLSLAGLTG